LSESTKDEKGDEKMSWVISWVINRYDFQPKCSLCHRKAEYELVVDNFFIRRTRILCEQHRLEFMKRREVR